MTLFPLSKSTRSTNTERMLMDRLRKDFGVSVKWQKELVGFKDEHDAQRVVVWLKRASGKEQVVEANYMAGCGGSHSVVRKTLGISFPSGIYDQVFYVADIVGAGPAMDGELHVCLDQADFLATFPLAGQGRARLIGTVRHNSFAVSRDLSFEGVSAALWTR
ncbi:hypothetical protein J3459_014174 [Metarhizium acridum]|uniref:uncharacterized protein n=1 Tax=Metarhizium acridum TaxID=92637 RepID=UPI001C6B5C42|nr:hypothetical protein J3458_012673 [Metarhizium acridum]KAG8414681.1 hypothetical protein J3459_014174 [Metarhizium acridum]